MVQEFHLSITPVRSDEYLVRVEWMEPGVPLAEEQVRWPVDNWLARARKVFTEPLAACWNRESGDSQNRQDPNNDASDDGISLLKTDLTPDPDSPPSVTDDYQVITFNPAESSKGSLADLSQPGSSRTKIAAEPALVQLGQELYDALFQGTIRDSWVMAQGVAQNHECPLRLRIGMKGDRLTRLPWEVLHAANRPLAAATDIVFSRYHSGFSTVAPAQLHTLTEPPLPNSLRILMVLAAPTDQASLELKREALQLQQELESRRSSDHPSQYPQVELELLEHPGREALTQQLEQAQYQVFHFAGHSSPGPAGGKLQLVNATTGLTENLNGDDLAGLLVNNGIKLAVFNSCLGTQAATSNEFDLQGERTLAEALIHRGIPSVLAMAERIPDQVALNLSRLFYRNLKFGHPLDVSLCRARQGLISSYGSNQLYWALPILYLQTNFEGRLVRPLPENAAPPVGRSPLGKAADAIPSLEGNYRDGSGAVAASLWADDIMGASDEPGGTSNDTLEQTSLPLSSPLSELSSELSSELAARQENQFDQTALGNQPDHSAPLDLQTALTLSDQDEAISHESGASTSSPTTIPPRSRRAWQPVLWGVGAIAAISLIGLTGWNIARLDKGPKPSETVDLTPLSPDQYSKTVALVDDAVDAFRREDEATAIAITTQLLDRNDLKEAEVVLGVPDVQQLTPEVNYLLGRLNWQKQTSSPSPQEGADDAYRFWNEASKEEPENAKYQTALGFAAYAKGDLTSAKQHWQKATKELSNAPTGSAERQLFLNAKAGSALLTQKRARQEPLGEQSKLLREAISGYNLVLAEASATFMPESLGRNSAKSWLWTEALISEWLELSREAAQE